MTSESSKYVRTYVANVTAPPPPPPPPSPHTLGGRGSLLEVGVHGADKQLLHPAVHVGYAVPGRVSLAVQLQQVPSREEGNHIRTYVRMYVHTSFETEQ